MSILDPLLIVPDMLACLSRKTTYLNSVEPPLTEFLSTRPLLTKVVMDFPTRWIFQHISTFWKIFVAVIRAVFTSYLSISKPHLMDVCSKPS